jgi:hypothetical protein
MTYDPDAAERLAELHDYIAERHNGLHGTVMAGSDHSKTAALIRVQAAEIERLKATYAPGHIDMMVSPESLDRWLEDNPPPADPVGDAMREVVIDVAAHLAAAISLLERGDKGAKIRDPAQPDADEREAMVETIKSAFEAYSPATQPTRWWIRTATDALLAAGWTRKQGDE